MKMDSSFNIVTTELTIRTSHAQTIDIFKKDFETCY